MNAIRHPPWTRINWDLTCDDISESPDSRWTSTRTGTFQALKHWNIKRPTVIFCAMLAVVLFDSVTAQSVTPMFRGHSKFPERVNQSIERQQIVQSPLQRHCFVYKKVGNWVEHLWWLKPYWCHHTSPLIVNKCCFCFQAFDVERSRKWPAATRSLVGYSVEKIIARVALRLVSSPRLNK